MAGVSEGLSRELLAQLLHNHARSRLETGNALGGGVVLCVGIPET
jgi:hypothetical protein